MVARAFPPFLPVGYSIREIKFIKYLPALGWEPVVLSVDDQQEYETLPKVGSKALLSEIQPTVKIIRTTPGEPSLRYLQKEKEFGGKNFGERPGRPWRSAYSRIEHPEAGHLGRVAAYVTPATVT